MAAERAAVGAGLRALALVLLATCTARAETSGGLPAGAPTTASASGAPARRFFLGGDGVLEIENAHTHEKVRVRYRDKNGAYSAVELEKLDGLFRSRGDDARTRVSLRLVELIDYLEDQAKPKPLFLISGYRSEGYNSALIARGGQAARTSMHSEGLAADLRFGGVDQRALWLRVRQLECCGAGYYANSGFLHVDTGRPRFWEETTSRVGENLSKGNARVIARTDFDRYGDLLGVETTLHGISVHPLLVSSRATLVAADGGAELARLALAAPGGDARSADDCITVDGRNAGAREVLRVTSVEPRGTFAFEASPEGDQDPVVRARVALTSCAPRLEATPERIESNPIEASAAALRARGRSPGPAGGG